MTQPLKAPPAYAITSVDHALRLATILQLEGALTVGAAAERLSVARSTAHRLLQMLVYRDFAAQDPDRSYRAGPVLELAAHSRSDTARLRAASMPALRRLADVTRESANIVIRAGATSRFILSMECDQSLRVGTREGMVFPAHRTTAGLLLLAELDPAEVEQVYDADRTEAVDRPEFDQLVADLKLIRRQGFAVNLEQSERGVVAVGVPIRDAAGVAIAGVSLSMPSVRYEAAQLPGMVGLLNKTAGAIEAELRVAV